jgi:pimeloyl-ACP methyl ester carboxylesterase
MHIAGTSLGGLIALRLAQRAPHLVRTLMLIDSAGLGRGLPSLVRAATLPIVRGFASSSSRVGLEIFFRRYLVGSHRALPTAQRRALIAYLQACARAGGGATLEQNMAHFASLTGQREVLGDAELNALAVPVLVLWGERDRFLPVQHAERAARCIRGARLVRVPDAGHSPNWEAPEAVIGAIREFHG